MLRAGVTSDSKRAHRKGVSDRRKLKILRPSKEVTKLSTGQKWSDERSHSSQKSSRLLTHILIDKITIRDRYQNICTYVHKEPTIELAQCQH